MIDALRLALILDDYDKGCQLLMADFCLDMLREEVPEHIRDLRCRGADRQRAVINRFHREGFRTDFLLVILKKKLQFLAQANTDSQVYEILRGSAPIYRADGFHPQSPYHVEEEELIQWLRISTEAPMMYEAKIRALELFGRCRKRLEEYPRRCPEPQTE